MMTHDHANPLERCAGFLSPALSPVLGRLGCSLPRSLSPWLVPTTFTFRIAAAPFRPSKLRLAAVTAALIHLGPNEPLATISDVAMDRRASRSYWEQDGEIS